MSDQKLILFDLGGVVIDIDFSRIWKHWSKSSGIDLSNAQETLGPTSTDNEAFHQFERGEISEAEYYQRTASRTGIILSFEQWRAGWNAIFVGEMPGTLDLLTELRDQVRLMALSNINAPHQAFTVQHFSHLLKPFEYVAFSHELGLRKPEKAIFDSIIRRSELDAKNILFFDDMAINVQGARDAGLRAELYVNAVQARPLIADFLKGEA
jgi:glucose-1-phosphatase